MTAPTTTHARTATVGAALVLGSGVCFGLAALFAKGAYAGGASVLGMLITRYVMAVALLWLIVAVRRPAIPAPRVVLTAIGLGAGGYALQSGLYFGAIEQMDAGLAALLLYVYPAIVTVIGVALRRESPSRRKAVALACSAVGLALLLGLGGLSSATPTGIALALGGAVTYAVYTVVAATIPADSDVFVLAALIITSALVSLVTFAAFTQAPVTLGSDPAVWVWIGAFAVVGTVMAVAFHQAGLMRIGPSTTAILSCVEPVVAAVSVALVYGEHLTIGQVAGGAAVLTGVVVLQLGPSRPVDVPRQVPAHPVATQDPAHPAAATQQPSGSEAQPTAGAHHRTPAGVEVGAVSGA